MVLDRQSLCSGKDGHRDCFWKGEKPLRKNLKSVILMITICITMLTGCGITEHGKTVSNKDRENVEDTVGNSKSVDENSTEGKKKDDLKECLTMGNENYKGFQMDNVLHSVSLGDIHFHIYVPDSYDGSEMYALYVTLPGYEGLYFQGAGANLKSENFAFESQKYNDKMIIVAPQLDDWQETSANKTVELVKFLMEYYNIDHSKVYANGYSGGGETMSFVLEKVPELFTAYLQCSSRWDGDFSGVIENRLPVYFVIGENDEYYGSEPTKQTYEKMREEYEKQGLTVEQIDKLLILDVKEHAYFADGGVSVEHGGGVLFAQDKNIMGWLFSQEK